MNNKSSSLIAQAVSLFGSQAKLGKAVGFSQHAVWHAMQRGRVSAQMAVAIDRATKGEISKVMLRPDLFGA